EPAGDNRLRLRNVSNSQPVGLTDGKTCNPLETCDLKLPIALNFGRKVVRIQETAEDDAQLQSLDQATSAVGDIAMTARFATIALSVPQNVEMESIITWLQT